MQSELNTNNERWVAIDGWEDYEVSDLGRVRNVRRGKIKSQAVYWNGYRYVCLHGNGIHKNKKVHRLVALAFIPMIEGKNYVNHIDFDKDNNCVDNLEWVTAGENLKHSEDAGRLIRFNSDNNPKVKITRQVADKIRLEYSTGVMNQPQLAMVYGVSDGHINNIIRNRVWKN